MSSKRKKESRMLGLQGQPSRVKIPLEGKNFSNNVVAATLSAYSGHRCSDISAAVRLPSRVRTDSFLLNRMATGAGWGSFNDDSGSCPSVQRLGFAPLLKAAMNKSTTTKLPPFGWMPSKMMVSERKTTFIRAQ